MELPPEVGKLPPYERMGAIREMLETPCGASVRDFLETAHTVATLEWLRGEG